MRPLKVKEKNKTTQKTKQTKKNAKTGCVVKKYRKQG